MPPRNIRIALFSRMLSRLPSTRWPRIRVMMPVRRSPPGSMNLPIHPSIENFWKQCLITTESYSVLKTNSKCSSRRRSREGCPFHKCCLRRRKSFMKRPRRWLINIVGSCLHTSLLGIKTMATAIVSCSTNLKSFKIKKLIAIFTRQ